MILKLQKVISLFVAVILLVGMMPMAIADSASSTASDLTPAPNHYDSTGKLVNDNGNVILSKQAERIGPDEWRVTVSADIKEPQIHKQQIEMLILLDLSGSMNWCTDPGHNTDDSGYHIHSSACLTNPANCNRDHQHGTIFTNCCGHQTQSGYEDECKYLNENGQSVDRPSRLSFAHASIETLTKGLPANTRIRYAYFKGKSTDVASTDVMVDYEDFKTVSTGKFTPLKDGTEDVLGHYDAFTTDPSTKKFLVIITDGDSTDKYPTNSPKFMAFKANGGTVFTIGFTNQNPNLVTMAAPNGKFIFAGNENELNLAVQDIKGTISAMINDPMGDQVDLISGSLEYDTSVFSPKDFNTENDNIFWNPETDPIYSGLYTYSYTVKLTPDAMAKAGSFPDVPLNNTTTLNYSVTNTSNGNTTSTSYTVDFPIPKAEYKISTLQVNWKCGDVDVKSPTKTESVICDYVDQTSGGAPAFKTDDQIAESDKEIHQSERNYYVYTSTTIEKLNSDGTKQPVNAVDPFQPWAYIVTHNYRLDEMYDVVYEYTGPVLPDGVPAANSYNKAYEPDETVTVPAPTVEGYQFSGWTIVEPTGLSVENGSFAMPKQNVKLRGSWEKLPSYKVLVNYFTKTDGGEYVADNVEAVEFVPVTYTDKASVERYYTEALKYNGNTYGDIELKNGKAKIDETNQKLTGIEPGDPTAVVEINLYREVENFYKLYVKESFTDGSVHEGFSSRYVLWDETDYTFDSSWSVTPKPAPEGYELVDAQSGEAASSTVVEPVTPGLNGESFGAADKYVVVTYAKRPTGKVTVHYVNSEGKALQDATTSEEIYIGSDYDVSDAEEVTTITKEGKIYDFFSHNVTESLTYKGKMPADGVEITRTYVEREKKTAVVRYVDGEGKDLQDATTSEAIYIGNDYDVSDAEEVTTITKEGKIYDFFSHNVTESLTYKGEMPADGVEITRTYVEREKKTAVVHYVNSEGNDLQDATTSKAIYIGNDYDVSVAEEVTTITKEGKIYDFFSHNVTESLTYKGKMPADGVEITRTYVEREKKTAVVHYVNSEGNVLQDATTSKAIYIGSDYDVSAAEEVTTITKDGKIYEFVNDTANESLTYKGKMPADGVEITRIYAERGKKTAVVHYVDGEGKALQDATTSKAIYIGSDYDVSAAEEVATITKDGVVYDFVGDDIKENGTAYAGTMPAGGVKIIRTYAERGKETAVVHYMDGKGNSLQDATTSEEIYIGSDYDVSAAEEVTTITKDGVVFDFIGDDIKENGTAYAGTMPAGGVEITRIYAERGKKTAVVRYVDGEGKALQDATTSEAIYIGSDYDVSVAEKVATITKDGKIYDFAKDNVTESLTYKGKMPADGVEITRTYAERGKKTAVVRYVDGEGNSLQDATTSEAIYIGSDYDVSVAEKVATITKDGVVFDFIGDDIKENGTAYAGTMPAGGVEITRTYAERGKKTAVVHYVDGEGNVLQVDTTSEAIYIGSDYDVSAAEEVTTITKDGKIYDFAKDNVTESLTYKGEMPADGVEITRIYAERGKKTAVVHYVDGEGNVLQADTASEAIYIGNDYDVSAAEKVTTIIKDGVVFDFIGDDIEEKGTAYTGTMPAGGVEITRVYLERNKARVVVSYVDETGAVLREGTSQTKYVGETYDVSAALGVKSIVVDGNEYEFVSHFRNNLVSRSVNNENTVTDADYSGVMPEGGLDIVRVYKLKTVDYYYGLKHVYTTYDASGKIVYSGSGNWPVMRTNEQVLTINSPAFYQHEGIDYQRVGEATQTADLTGTTEDAPYVFVVNFEYREPEIVIPPQTQRPPQTGDEGVGLWVALMAASLGMMFALKATEHRKKCHSEK